MLLAGCVIVGTNSGRRPLAGVAAATEDLGCHVLVGCGKRKGHWGIWLCSPIPETHCYLSSGSYWASLSHSITPLLSQTSCSTSRSRSSFVQSSLLTVERTGTSALPVFTTGPPPWIGRSWGLAQFSGWSYFLNYTTLAKKGQSPLCQALGQPSTCSSTHRQARAWESVLCFLGVYSWADSVISLSLTFPLKNGNSCAHLSGVNA